MKKGTKSGSLRTAIYVRVSTEEQAQEGYSVRAQTDKLKSYALLKEWDIYDIYSDEGISGKNIVDRPAVNRLIDDINDGKVNNVLVFKVDRLTRNTKNLIELVELFEEKGCAFNSLTESIDTDTPTGRMFLKIIGIFAEFERENLVTRLKLGFERKVKEGYTLATNTFSYGYIREKGQKIQEVIPDEAKIVKEIFTMYVDGNMSLNGIAKELNARKIPTKMNAQAWEMTQIKQIITNPTYVGKVRYSTGDEDRYFEVDGHHERIITDEQFYLAQERIKIMSNVSRTKRPKEENYFCGVLVCAMCEGKFTTHNNYNKSVKNAELKRMNSYRCSNKKASRGELSCKSPNISHDKVDSAFIEYIRTINDLSAVDDIDIENDNSKKEQELLDYIKSCERNLDNLQAHKKRFIDQYVAEEISFSEYKELLNAFNVKHEMLELELERAQADLPIIKDSPFIIEDDIIQNLQENWEYLNNSEKMMFLQNFVKKMVIRIERERARWNIVEIEKLEFNDVREPLIKGQSFPAVRSKLQEQQR